MGGKGEGSDGVNERLNGLVNLLQEAGIDGVDSGALVEEQKRQSHSKSKSNSNKKTSKKKASSTSTSKNNNDNNNNNASDVQILEIIKKLQQAQADSPEILEALKSPELLALASLAAQKQGLVQASSSSVPSPSPVQTKQKKSMAACLDEIDDDDNYPKIGPGYSDEASVMSDMSTPTVMTRQQVADEEHYREMKVGYGNLPPMQIGTGGGPGGRPARTSRTARPSVGGTAGMGGGGKNKNMVGQVRPVANRRVIPVKTGGAAAQRRLNYQMAMNKLQSTGFGKQTPVAIPTSPTPSAISNSKENKKSKKKPPSRTASGSKSVGSGGGSGGSGSGGRRKPSTSSNININTKTKSNNKIDWGMTDEIGWPTFDEDNKTNSSTDRFVDNDGFFTQTVLPSNDGSAGTDPTSTTTDRRKKSGKPPSRRNINGSSSGSKKKSSRDDGSGTSKKTHRVKKEKDTSSENTRKSKEKEKSSGRRKSRRESMSL